MPTSRSWLRGACSTLPGRSLVDRDSPIERISIEWPSCIFGRLREGVCRGCLVEIVDGVEGHPFAVGDRSGDELRGGWQSTEHDQWSPLFGREFGGDGDNDIGELLGNWYRLLALSAHLAAVGAEVERP